jgi:PadR family transcriptional regulator, regulatory protein PadR
MSSGTAETFKKKCNTLGPGIVYLCKEAALNRGEIPPGTMHMLILRSLARNGKMHGFEIAKFIEGVSADVLRIEEGSLYPALQRMLMKGWVTSEWGTTAENRRARYYRLTQLGKKQLEVEVGDFERVMGAVARVIQTA